MDRYVEELLHTLVRVTDTPFANGPVLTTLRQALGLDLNDYRNGVTQTIYGELDPSKSTTTARYKTLAIAYAVSKTANKGYDYGSKYIKPGTSPSLDEKLATEARKIAVPLYRNYLEMGIKNQGSEQDPDFLTLFTDPDFCIAFARKVLQPEFINDQLIAVYAGGNKAYPQGIAYLYERMRRTLAVMPADRADIHGKSPELVSRTAAGDQWKLIAEKHEHFINNPQQLAEFLDKSLPLKWSDQDVLQEPSFPAIGDSFNIEFIKSQDMMDLAQSACSKTDSKEEVATHFLSGAPPPIITYTYYGRDLIDWMNKQAAGGYSDVFSHGDVYSTSKYSNALTFGSCFVSGTKVRTDRDSVPIEQLMHGDRVLARLPGSYGVVSNEKVEVPTGGTVWLYGFNDEEPFFTGGHIFITKAGPKAMVPEIARMESPDIQVHQIAAGDVFYKINDRDSTTYTEVEITKITTKRYSLDNVYGVHFRKGAKGTCSYHANGYLVVANYPEITLNRLQDNFLTLSHKEQQSFSKAFASIPSSLKTTFGPVLTESFEKAFVNKSTSLAHHFTSQKAQYKSKTDKYHLSSHNLVRHFPLLHWNNFRKRKVSLHSHEPDYTQKIRDINNVTGHILPQISVSQGSVLIDNKLVKHARVDRKEIHWSRPLGDDESGEWEHGMLQTSADGFWAQGAIGTGPSPSATPATHSLSTLKNTVSVAAASTANDYNLLCSVQGASNDGTFKTTTAADSTAYPGNCNWGTLQKVEIGLSLTPKGAVQVKVTFPDIDANWGDDDPLDILYTSTSAVDQAKWVLNVTINAVPGMEEFLAGACSPGTLPFSIINLKVDLATNNAWGDFTELLQTGDDTWGPGAIRAVQCPYSPKVSALKNTALNAIKKSNLQASTGAPQALTANLHTTSSNVHLEPSPLTAHLSTLAATENADLPISFLQTMTTPADADLHAHSQNYMMAAAGYWRTSDETAVFGDEKAALDKTLPDALKSNLPAECQTFIGSQFSKSLLNYSMSRNTTYQGKYNDAQKEKLQFWWTGKTPKCLAHQKEYNDVTAITARIAFNDLADDNFKQYRDSPTDYANQLYEAVTDDSILNNLATSVILGNQNLVNRYCAILNALDRQNRHFDQTLWSLVQQKQFLILAAGSPTFDDDFSTFMKSYMEDLANKVASGDPSVDDDLKKEMKTDLDQLYATVQVTNAKDLAFQLFDAQTDLMENILIVIDFYKRRPMTGAQANAQGFFSKLEEKLDNTRFKAAFPYLKGIMMVGMQAYALYKAISFLMDWKDLSEAQRASAVLTCLEAVLRAIHDLASTWAEMRPMEPSSSAFKVRCVRWSNASKGRVKIEDEAGNEKPVIDQESVANVETIQEDGTIPPNAEPRSASEQIAESGATTQAEASTNLTKEFSLSSAVVEGVMVAVNISSAVVLGMELAKEWKRVDDGIRAMDTINLVVVCTQAVTGIIGVGAMVVGAELACLPGIGLLVCAAGIVMMFVEQFVPHPKPDPVQDYLDDHGYTYINALDSPPTPELQYTAVKSTLPSGQVQLDMTVTQPAQLNPQPMVKQLIAKIFAGTSDSDIFLPPTTDINNNVTAYEITWSLVDSVNGGFQIAGNDMPDDNDHSLLCRVYPTTAATYTNKGATLESAGTSIIGVGHTLRFKVVGTPNPAFKSMLGSITEILENPPEGVSGSDVIWSFTV